MGGQSTLYVSPCSAAITSANQTFMLAPGYPDGTLVATGVPDPRNLLSSSPPTLLEQYEAYAVSIAWGVQFAAAPPAGTIVNVELRLLVNDRIAWAAKDTGTVLDKVALGVFTADLVNPVGVGARDRLGLQVQLAALILGAVTGSFMLAAQPLDGAAAAPASNWKPLESTINYRVLDLPASRRL